MIKPHFKPMIRGEKVYRQTMPEMDIDELLDYDPDVVDDDDDGGDIGSATRDLDDEAQKRQADKSRNKDDDSARDNNRNDDNVDDFNVDDLDDDSDDSDEDDDTDDEDDDLLKDFDGDNLSYLNKRLGLNLDLEKLPEDFNDKNRAKLIGDIVERIVTGANSRIAEFSNISKLLEEDQEVKLFLEQKSKGKTLKDIASQYAVSPQGMPEDRLLQEELKIKFPDFEQEDIDDMIQNAKDKGKYEKMVESFRKQREAREEQELLAIEQEREQSLTGYRDFLAKTKDVAGIPLTNDMKSALYQAVSERDENGETQLDKLLQSDENIMKATIAIAMFDEFANAIGSVAGNKKKKSLIDRLQMSPEDVSTKGPGGQSKKTKEEDIARMANSF